MSPSSACADWRGRSTAMKSARGRPPAPIAIRPSLRFRRSANHRINPDGALAAPGVYAMPQRFSLLTFLFVTSAAVAQPPGANWGNLPYHTQVTQAANQLFYSVEQLNSAVGTLR